MSNTSHDINSEQEKDIENDSAVQSMNIDENAGEEEEGGNFSGDNNNSPVHNPLSKNTLTIKKKAIKSNKKSKHASKKLKYTNKSQRELAGNEASLSKQAKEHYLYKPFYSLPDL